MTAAKTYDYCVPVYGADGQGPYFTAASYNQPSDVAAKQDVEAQIALMCNRVTPNLLTSQFTVGQPVAVTMTAVS